MENRKKTRKIENDSRKIGQNQRNIENIHEKWEKIMEIEKKSLKPDGKSNIFQEKLENFTEKNGKSKKSGN